MDWFKDGDSEELIILNLNKKTSVSTWQERHTGVYRTRERHRSLHIDEKRQMRKSAGALRPLWPLCVAIFWSGTRLNWGATTAMASLKFLPCGYRYRKNSNAKQLKGTDRFIVYPTLRLHSPSCAIPNISPNMLFRRALVSVVHSTYVPFTRIRIRLCIKG